MQDKGLPMPARVCAAVLPVAAVMLWWSVGPMPTRLAAEAPVGAGTAAAPTSVPNPAPGSRPAGGSVAPQASVPAAVAVVQPDGRPDPAAVWTGTLRITSLKAAKVPAALGATVLSADGRTLAATVEAAPELLLIAADTGVIRKRVALAEPALRIVRVGATIWAAGRRTLWLVDTTADRVTAMAPLSEPPAEAVAPLPARDSARNPGSVPDLPVGKAGKGERPSSPGGSATKGAPRRGPALPLPVPTEFRTVAEDVRGLSPAGGTASHMAGGSGLLAVVARAAPAGRTVVQLRDGRTGEPRGPAVVLPELVVDDPGAEYLLSPDGARLLVQRPGRLDLLDTADGRVLYGRDGAGARVQFQIGARLFAADGAVLDAGTLEPAGATAGPLPVPHPVLPAVLSFAPSVGDPRVERAGVGRFDTVVMRRLPDLAEVARIKAPATLIARVPHLAGASRVAVQVRAVEITPAAAALLNGELPPLPAVVPVLGRVIWRGLVPGPLVATAETLWQRAPQWIAGLTGRPGSAAGKPAGAGAPAPSGSGTPGRETILVLADVDGRQADAPAATWFAALPRRHAAPGSTWAHRPVTASAPFQPSVTTPATGPSGTAPVAGNGAITFAKVAGPAGLTVDAATGEMRFEAGPADVGRHAVEVSLRGPGGEDRLRFPLLVQGPQVLLPVPARWERPLRAAVIAGSPDADGAGHAESALTLVAVDGSGRKLLSFPLTVGEGGADAVSRPAAERSLEAPPSAMAGDLATDVIAISTVGSGQVQRLSAATLQPAGPATALSVEVRWLTAVPGSAVRVPATGSDARVGTGAAGGVTTGFLAGGTGRAGTVGPGAGVGRTFVIDAATGRIEGDPIPAAGPMALAPDGRTLLIGGDGAAATVVVDLPSRRVVARLLPGEEAPAGLAVPPALLWSVRPASAVGTGAAAGGWNGTPGSVDAAAGGTGSLPGTVCVVAWGEAARAAETPVPPGMRAGPGFSSVRITGRRDRATPEVTEADLPPVPVAVVTPSGRRPVEWNLPLPGRVLAAVVLPGAGIGTGGSGGAAGETCGGTLVVAGPDRVQFWPMAGLTRGASTQPVLSTDPPSEVVVGQEWTYRPAVFGLPAVQRAGAGAAAVAGGPEVRLITAPRGMRAGADGVIRWRPDDTDIGPAGVRLSVRTADGRVVAQDATVTVQPASVTPPDDPRAAGRNRTERLKADPAGDGIWQRGERDLTLLSADGGAPLRLLLGERAGAITPLPGLGLAGAAGDGPLAGEPSRVLAVALPESSSVALLEDVSGGDPRAVPAWREVGRVRLGNGRPRRLVPLPPLSRDADAPEGAGGPVLLVVTDDGEVRGLGPARLSDRRPPAILELPDKVEPAGAKTGPPGSPRPFDGAPKGITLKSIAPDGVALNGAPAKALPAKAAADPAPGRAPVRTWVDHGVIAWGQHVAAAPDGSRFWTIARTDRLPERLREDLATLAPRLATDASGAPAKAAKPAAVGNAVRQGSVNLGVVRDLRPVEAWLFTWRRSGEAITLIDAAPWSGSVEHFAAASGGRTLVAVRDGRAVCADGEDPSRPTADITPEGERIVELLGVSVLADPAGEGARRARGPWLIAASGSVFEVVRQSGRTVAVESDVPGLAFVLERVADGGPAVDWSGAADGGTGAARGLIPDSVLPGKGGAAHGPASRGLTPEVVLGAAESGLLWIGVRGRVCRLPLYAARRIEVDVPGAGFVDAPDDLTYRPGQPWGGAPKLRSVDAALTFRLVAGPSGMQIDPRSGRTGWMPSRLEDGPHRVVIELTDAEGATARVAFVLRRARG